ncbi:MAG: hypothetical protein KDI88_01340 [Gammaproteobacteria bacterium]|nr:hypothetical protein [Gammaproteobacteria bacterium]
MIQLDEPKRELAYVIFGQKWKIMTLTLICTLAAVYVSLFWPSTYGSYGTLLVKSRNAEVNIEALQSTDARAEPVRKEDLYSEISILTSNEVLQRAINRLQQDDALGLAAVQEAWGMTESKQLRRLRSMFTATVVPTSNVINLDLQGPSPEFTRRALAEILDQYIRFRLEVFSPERAVSFLGGQLSYFREELTTKKTELLQELEVAGVTLPERQIDYNLQLQRDLVTRRQDIETQAVQLRSLIDRIANELVKPDIQFFSFVDNATIQNLGQSLQTLVADHHAKAHLFLAGREEVAQSNAHIARAYSTLKQEVRAYMLDKQSELSAMQRSIRQLDTRIDDLEGANMRIRRGKLKVEDIERDLALLRSSYETFFVRNEEALTASNPELAFLNSYVSILTPATAHDKALFPQPRTLIPLGVITGLILGLSLGFLYEYFDQTFKRPMEVEDVLGLPVIFSLNYKEDLDPVEKTSLSWAGASAVAVLVLLVGLGGWRVLQDTDVSELATNLSPGQWMATVTGAAAPDAGSDAGVQQAGNGEQAHEGSLGEVGAPAPLRRADDFLVGLAALGDTAFTFSGARSPVRSTALGFDESMDQTFVGLYGLLGSSLSLTTATLER